MAESGAHALPFLPPTLTLYANIYFLGKNQLYALWGKILVIFGIKRAMRPSFDHAIWTWFFLHLMEF